MWGKLRSPAHLAMAIYDLTAHGEKGTRNWSTGRIHSPRPYQLSLRPKQPRSWTLGGMTSGDERRGGLVEPRLRRIVELPANLASDARVVGVEPVAFRRAQHADLDEAPVDRRECQRLERVHRLFGTSDVGGDHQLQILDPDAVAVGLVIAGLIGQDHAALQGRCAEL